MSDEHFQNIYQKQMEEHFAPPIGIEPEFIWREHRCVDLSETITRILRSNSSQDYKKLRVWAKELNRHLKYLEGRIE